MLALVVFICTRRDGSELEINNTICRFEHRQPSAKEIHDLEYSLNRDHLRYFIKIVNIIELHEKRDCYI